MSTEEPSLEALRANYNLVLEQNRGATGLEELSRIVAAKRALQETVLKTTAEDSVLGAFAGIDMRCMDMMKAYIEIVLEKGALDLSKLKDFELQDILSGSRRLYEGYLDLAGIPHSLSDPIRLEQVELPPALTSIIKDMTQEANNRYKKRGETFSDKL